MTIHVAFTVQAAGADAGRRLVEGIAVPWGVEGRVASGETVRFHPGSLDAAARPVALRDHDRTRTIGRVADAVDDGTQMRASVTVSRTQLGDESLVLAGDGALMFSVGADPTRYSFDANGVLDVYAADWNELSLLPLGAYSGAVVTRVAAASHTQGDPMNPTATDTPDPEVELDPEAPPAEGDEENDEETAEGAQAPQVVPIAAGAARRRRGIEAANLRDVSRIIAASRGGDPQAMRRRDMVLAAQGPALHGIEAALTNVTMIGGDNVSNAYRPTYQAELVEIIGWGTPTIDALRQGDLERGDYPNKTFNTWTKAPKVALQSAEKTAINSTAVGIAPTSVPVKTWATGNDLSQQLLDLGSPSFVEDYIRAAGIDYATQTDTYAVNALLAAATPVATVVSDTFPSIIGKLLAGLTPATTPPGGLFCAVASDAYNSLYAVKQVDGPAFWEGRISFGQYPAEMSAGGLSIFPDPNLPARTYLLGHRQGATWYDLPGVPFTLRAVNVGLLGLDVGIYGYGALGIQYPGSFTKTTQPSS